ncbi:MAG: HD domain-containing phosphohydrolase [Candidatus Baltobacteraceae bacterium]
MTLFQDTGANPSPSASALADLLSLFGAIADFAVGSPRRHSRRIASLSLALAETAELSNEEQHALAFASLLHGIGALGNSAYRKHDPLSSRSAQISSWDVPPEGARICGALTMLPKDTADYVRWHAESWDGTGYPDQLRWHGTPRAAQLIHIAHTYLEAGEAEDGLAKIVSLGGMAFSPELTRSFVMWFHTNSGEIAVRPLPAEVLTTYPNAANDLLNLVADRIDLHNAAPGRWQRVAARAGRTAEELKLGAGERETLELATRLFGIGELRADTLESQDFDALSTLGRDERAQNAVAAADLLDPFEALQSVAATLRARAEWFDGTGLPNGLRHEAIRIEARVLAPCIAYDALEQSARAQVRSERIVPLERIEDASGTQFDPAVVRAHSEVAPTLI